MKTEWEELKYGGWNANLGYGMILSVYWEGTKKLQEEEGKWNVTVLGNRLKKRAKNEQEGKEIAEKEAKEILTKALSKLG